MDKGRIPCDACRAMHLEDALLRKYLSSFLKPPWFQKGEDVSTDETGSQSFNPVKPERGPFAEHASHFSFDTL